MVLPIFQQQVASNDHIPGVRQRTDAAPEWTALSFLRGLSANGTYPRRAVESAF